MKCQYRTLSVNNLALSLQFGKYSPFKTMEICATQRVRYLDCFDQIISHGFSHAAFREVCLLNLLNKR